MQWRILIQFDTDDKGTHLTSTSSGNQNMSIINESGLYTAYDIKGN